MYFKTYYNPPTKVGVTFKKKSLCRQEFLKESLTSTIIDRFTRTGILTPSVNSARIAQFGDFSACPNDFFEANCRMQELRDTFMTLPATIRAEFSNNPIAFASFMADGKNRKRAEELGLIDKTAEAVKPAPSSQPAEQAKAETVVE